MSKTVIELNTAAADLIAWLDCCGIESHFVEKVRAKLEEHPVQKRPQNCGTNHCSCIECVMEPAPAAPELIPVPDDEIGWNGGKWSGDSPVPGATKVQVEFRDGNTGYDFARAFDWNHSNDNNDIVAYRVATTTPQAPKEKT